MQLGLSPVCRLQVKDDHIGEMLAVFVLSTKDQQLAALPQTCCMAHPYTRYVSIVVYEVPLPCCEVQAEDVVVHFVGVLVEASECIYLVIAYVGDRRIDEAGRLGTDGGDHLGPVALDGGSAAPHRARGHEKSVVAGSVGSGRMGQGR
jgi:hypothetical protein